MKFEPEIVGLQSNLIDTLFFQITEVTKNAFDVMLAEPRAQRNRVNEAFLEAYHRLEQQHKGFGVNFWGSTWRFRVYEDLFSAARRVDGALLPCTARYAHLKERLAAMAQGKDPWLKGPAAADPLIKREVGNWEGVRLFCAEWRALIDREEERDAARAAGQAKAEAARATKKAEKEAAVQRPTKELPSDTSG